MFSRLISVAPMMDCTDKHDRYFLRLISPQTLLYSEMITAQAIIHGNRDRLLKFHSAEKPLALQLGGSDPKLLAESAKIGEDYAYDEINLNVGCPSDRVKSGSFGACLMLNPALVAECIHVMQQVVQIPVTIKCRIGVDERDSYEDLYHFIRLISQAGCRIFIIHARKAWLTGLSPKENREVPPLKYSTVWQIKKDFPELTIIINGGINTLDAIDEQLAHVDGVMIGRAAYSNPFFLSAIQNKYFNSVKQTRCDVIQRLLPYVSEQLQNNVKLTAITRHLFGLFFEIKGAAAWRRYLSQHAYRNDAGIEVIQEALALIEEKN